MFISKAFAGNDFYYVYLSGPMPSDVKSHAIMQSLIRLATFPCHSRQQTGCALNCGWLRRAFFKACPPVACTIARPDLPARLGTPVDLRSTPIRGRGFAAYLSACGGQPFNVRYAHYARGASLSTFGFVTIVPRYLLPQVIPSHSFAALTALIVRRVNGHGDQPRLACTSSRAPPEGALACAPGSGTLPPT